MRLTIIAKCQGFFTGSAVPAPAIAPIVLSALEPDIPSVIRESSGNRVLTYGVL